MGLFGPKKPLDDYLRQRSGEVLRQIAFKRGDGFCFVDSALVFDRYTEASAIPRVEVNEWVSIKGTLMKDKQFNSGGVEPIPHGYCKEPGKVTAQHLLELAGEKGDGDACFYLSLIHEYGMVEELLEPNFLSSVAAGRKTMAQAREEIIRNRNPKLAKEYMEKARALGCELAKEYQVVQLAHLFAEQISDDKERTSVFDPLDAQLASICECYISSDGESLLHKLPPELARFLGLLLAFYAGYEFLDSMWCFCVQLIRTVKECGSSTETFCEKYHGDLLGFFFAGKETLEEMTVRVINRVQYLVENGRDPAAAFIRRKLNKE